MLVMEKVLTRLTEIFLPLISSYHLLSENPYFNETPQNASGIEKVASVSLIPFHYVFGGKVVTSENERVLRFDYDSHLLSKSTVALLTLPLSAAVGLPLRAAAYFKKKPEPSYTFNHRKFEPALLAVMGELASSTFPRRPGDENYLQIEKNALAEIARLFKKHEIPFWVDCGTCLGAYRHRGVIPWDEDIDVAILQKDHDRVRAALSELDPAKYHLQDWSNRSLPKTFLRLYVKESRSLIDIYHFHLDEKTETLHYILSNEDSAFVPESWKVRERNFKVPTPLNLVFPLKKSSLDGVEIFVPNKTKEYLQLRYGQDLSPAKLYNPETGQYEKNLDHPYWKAVSRN